MHMTARELEEYRALRATIRQRGSSRIWMAVGGLTAWAALTLATFALPWLTEATLLSLLVLAASFEAVFMLHTATERVGRYLQVFYEGEERNWETTAMALGRTEPGSTADALFSVFFWMAAVLNILPAAAAQATLTEWAVLAPLHLVFVGRVAAARRRAGAQRAVDLDRFQALKQAQIGPTTGPP
jgi:hypothetical protein